MMDVDAPSPARAGEDTAVTAVMAGALSPARGATAPAWWRYVMTVTGGAAHKDIAAASGIDPSSISRWQRGAHTPRAQAVVALARAYGRSPVEALVAAGYLSDGELGVVPPCTVTADLSGASIDALLGELGRRAASQWHRGGPFPG